MSDGRKRSRRFHGAYREAVAALSTFRGELEAECACSDTFGGYAQSWLDYLAKMGEIRYSTLRRYRNAVRALDFEFKDVRLSDMTPERCRVGIAAIKSGNNFSHRELSGAYMAKLYSVLHAILKMAVEDERINRDPLANSTAPKVDTREKDALSPAQLAALVGNLEALPMDGKVMCYLLMAYLGLRRGETCALLVDDIDFDRSIVHVRHGIEEQDFTVAETKTHAGVRDLPAPPQLLVDVRRWLDARSSMGWSACPTLACNARGTLLRPSDLEKWWNGHRAELGAEGMTMHQIRHSNLSMMARHLNVFDLQRWAGWASIEPARVYVHADAESLANGCADAFRHHFGTI